MRKFKGCLYIGLIMMGMMGCATSDVAEKRNLEMLVIDSNPVIQDVVSRYNMEQKINNTGYKLEISKQQIGGNEESLQQLSTKILSGDTPDILDLTYLPYNKYTEKGVLGGIEETKLKEIMPMYDPSISSVLTKEGKIYALPLSIGVPTIGVNKEILAQMEQKVEEKQYLVDEFLDLLNELEEQKLEGVYLLPKDSSEYILMHLLNIYYYTYDDYPEDTKKEEINKILEATDKLKRFEHPQFDMWTVLKNSKGERDQVVLFPNIVSYYNVITQVYDYIPMIALEKELYPVYANEIIGISTQKGVIKEKQEEFISYTFSDKMQYDTGFPARSLVVNTKARQEIINFHLQKYPELKASINIIEDMIRQTDFIISQELGVDEIRKQVGAYLYDNQSREKTVDEIYKRIVAYR